MLYEETCSERADRWAATLIKRFSLEPPIDIFELLERLEINLFLDPRMSDEFSGIYVPTGLSHNIYLNKRDSLERQRFSAGHELGHFGDCKAFPHKNGIHADRRKGCCERFCNLFAAHLLMPTPWVKSWAKELRHPQQDKTIVLASRFEVSITAMKARLEEMGLDYESKHQRYHEGYNIYAFRR